MDRYHIYCRVVIIKQPGHRIDKFYRHDIAPHRVLDFGYTAIKT